MNEREARLLVIDDVDSDTWDLLGFAGQVAGCTRDQLARGIVLAAVARILDEPAVALAIANERKRTRATERGGT